MNRQVIVKNRKNLAIIIPTSNRYTSIATWLAESLKGFDLLGIDVIIFDSSTNIATEAIAQHYLALGYRNLIYDRWNGQYDGFSIDNKVIDAYKKYAESYEYLWMFRDGLLIFPESVAGYVLPLLDRKIDFVVVNIPVRDEKGIGNRTYTDPVSLFSDQCVQMTILGATIFRTDYIMEIINTIPLEKGRNYGLYQPIAIFEYIEKHQFCASSVVKNIFTFNPGAPTGSFWNKRLMLQWCDYWIKNIDNLGNIYNAQKKEILKIEMYDFHPFSPLSLIGVRSQGGFGLRDVISRRKKLARVTRTNIIVIALISIIPKGVANRMLMKQDSVLFKVIRSVYFLLFGISYSGIGE